MRDLSFAGWRVHLEFERLRVNCRQRTSVHVEHLDWLAKNPRCTQRFAMHVSNLCCDMTVSRVAEVERLHLSTVKDLNKLCMRRQVELAGTPTPRAIDVDEIWIHKGHSYSVSDLDRRRSIWVDSLSRKEVELDEFFRFIGKTKSKRIKLAAMDMWKAFRN